MRTREGNKEQAILEAAILVFAKYGYHNAKIYQIAQKAKVATGSVYVYYKNKEDLLQTIFHNMWQHLYQQLEGVTSKTELEPLEKIDSMIDFILDLFDGNPALAVVYVNEQIHMLRNKSKFTKYYDQFLEMGEDVVKEGINAGVFTNEINMDIFKGYIFGAIRNLVHKWAEDHEKYPINNIRKNIKYLLKNGILKR